MVFRRHRKDELEQEVMSTVICAITTQKDLGVKRIIGFFKEHVTGDLLGEVSTKGEEPSLKEAEQRVMKQGEQIPFSEAGGH